MPVLKRDIVGIFPPRTRFGTAGDQVEIISLHGHVFIVQGPSGMRYSAIADDMDGIPEEMEEEARREQANINLLPSRSSAPTPGPSPPQDPVPEPEDQPKPMQARKPAKPSTSKSTDNQGSLF